MDFFGIAALIKKFVLKTMWPMIKPYINEIGEFILAEVFKKVIEIIKEFFSSRKKKYEKEESDVSKEYESEKDELRKAYLKGRKEAFQEVVRDINDEQSELHHKITDSLKASKSLVDEKCEQAEKEIEAKLDSSVFDIFSGSNRLE
jgi:flagellar biosynthesis/type III secretory pathway protein FliH